MSQSATDPGSALDVTGDPSPVVARSDKCEARGATSARPEEHDGTAIPHLPTVRDTVTTVDRQEQPLRATSTAAEPQPRQQRQGGSVLWYEARSRRAGPDDAMAPAFDDNIALWCRNSSQHKMSPAHVRSVSIALRIGPLPVPGSPLDSPQIFHYVSLLSMSYLQFWHYPSPPSFPPSPHSLNLRDPNTRMCILIH